MINLTKDLHFLCDDKEVKELIIEAANLTKTIILDFEGKKSVSTNEAVNENARNKLKYCFIQYFNDIEKNPDLSKKWLNSLYHLVSNRTSPEYRKKIANFFTEETKLLPKQKAKLDKLRAHLHLFMHNLWCIKAVLLPTSYSRLPYEVVKISSKIEGKEESKNCKQYIGEDYYPQFLKLARSPLLQIPYDLKVNDHISPSSINNINWYAHRVVRAQDVWSLNDLNESHLEEYSKLKGNEDLGFVKTTGWFSAIIDVHEDKLGFSSDKLAVVRHAPTANSPTDWLTKKEAKDNPNHLMWERRFKEYVDECIEQGYHSAHKYHATLRRVILEPLLVKSISFPKILEYNREHLQVSKAHLKKRGLKSTTIDGYMRRQKEFLEWLESDIKGFKSPFVDKIDIPKLQRPTGTTKILVPEGGYPIILAYNYAICEFIDYVNFHANKELRRKLVLETNNKCLIDTEAWGFVPLYIVNGVLKAIKVIPSTLLSPIRVSETIKERGALRDNVIYPHNSNLIAVIMESGFRGIHTRWLDAGTYNSVSLTQSPLYPRGYGVNKVHVNTDKSHGPWDATVSDVVLQTLNNQLKFKNTFLRGPNKPIWYNNVKNSSFGKVNPLFAIAASDYKMYESFSVATGDSLSKYFRALLKAVSFEMLQQDETKHLAVASNHNDLNMLEFVNDSSIKIKSTVHSCRSQVVSDKITILPPHVIKQCTGHIDDAHVYYYAQIKDRVIANHEFASSEQFMSEIEAAIIDTQSENSALRKALRGNDLGKVLLDFGAVSFGGYDSTNQFKDGIKKLIELNKSKSLKSELTDLLYLDTTHICPFGNQCPDDIVQRFGHGKRHCGECPYSIKTVDHLSAIGMRLRKYTDALDEVQLSIDDAKKRKEKSENMKDEIEDKKFYSDEIAAWSATHSFLSKMTSDLSKKDRWLVEQPEIISQHLTQLKASNELTITLLKINDAEKSAAYMTPALKAKVSKLRKQLLVSTKDYKKLLQEPEGYDLLNDFKGIIATVCTLSGISLQELGDKLNALANDSSLVLDLK
ncbi:hypothetical protein BCT21_01155 [Vibrio sp. 10N.222.55.F9]|uniref:hypothetical protein n=1 Tax=Vibrio sp. 10N.222.55.F9 TaxID=1884471 RepID=UPI000C8541F6|nr:hypothetical protein [Vibrio sp. 10N.222.55.F9]PMN99158.1 hypothetical protein BCT21_01155 [Vibrio sp. 10N.222.55.F9]